MKQRFPDCQMTTAQTLLSIVLVRSWPLWQINIRNAFLHGDLHETVYMCPPGSNCPPKMMSLEEIPYGLKQAPQEWFDKSQQAILKAQLHQSYNDHSYFFTEVTPFYCCVWIIILLVTIMHLELVVSNDIPWSHFKWKTLVSRLTSLVWKLNILCFASTSINTSMPKVYHPWPHSLMEELLTHQ